MFRLRFFGSFAAQRRAFLASSEIAPIEFDPGVEEQFNALAAQADAPPPRVDSRLALFRMALRPILPLVLRSAAWNAVSSLTVLAGVVAAREVLGSSHSLGPAFGLSLLFFLARVAQISIEAVDVRRRAQIHRGLQMYLFRIVNQKICVLEPASTGEFSTGQLKTLIVSDVESVEDFLGAAITQWVPALVMISILGTAMWWFAGWLGTLALFLALLALPASAVGGRLIERFQGRAQAKQDALATVVGEWVKNIRLVRFLGWQRAIETQIAEEMASYCKEYAYRQTVANLVYGISWSWWMVPVLGMFLASSLTHEALTLEALFTTIWILSNLMNYVQMIPHSLSLYGSAAAGADRLMRFLGAREINRGLLPESSARVPLGRPVRLNLKALSRRYGQREALSGLSVSFDLTQRTAIVGSVASGKSTLLRLLIGEEIPDDGLLEVEFEDGTKDLLWRPSVYNHFRSRIAYSSQHPFLSNSLLRLNIDLSGSASIGEILAAAESAQLMPDIALFPLGLDQEVGETGINLSGGQKQRVSLARAFISKRDLYVLDDPLSAVDTATESALLDQLLGASKGVIMVSHRLNELMRFDRVLVLEEGRIVEDGRPVDLASRSESRFSSFLRAHG